MYHRWHMRSNYQQNVKQIFAEWCPGEWSIYSPCCRDKHDMLVHSINTIGQQMDSEHKDWLLVGSLLGWSFSHVFIFSRKYVRK